jgi:signal transduction histidine kinase/CheY-like chemotaxis protein
MERKEALAELLPFVRILILDDEPNVAKPVQFRLQQAGYPFVTFTDNIETAWNELENTNILLIDHYLSYSGKNGIEFTREAKKEYGADLDVIIYSGSVDKLAQNALEAGATACLEKPLIFEYLQLWIQETAKRIWLEKILDAIPDEVAIIDHRDEFFGRLHYINKAKREHFEQGVPLEYDYCWRRFEQKGKGTSPCPNCTPHNALTSNRTVRSYRKYVTWDNKNEAVDIHAAPIYDKTGVTRALIETCRIRTEREVMEENLRRIEAETDWSKRIDLFLHGFLEMGYKRIRFYQKLKGSGDSFQGLRALGMPDDFVIQKYRYRADEDASTRIVLQEKYPTLFLIKNNKDYNWTPASHYEHVYKVDDQFVPNNRVLSKQKWIEVPVIANNELIAKVSIDPKNPNQFISIYDLEILNHYANWAGQALSNAQQSEKLRLNDATNQLIIQMNRKISRMPLRPQWTTLAVKRVCEVLDTSSCSIFMLEGENENARLVRKATYLQNVQRQHIRKITLDENYKTGQSFVGSVFKSGHNRRIENLAQAAEEQRQGGRTTLNLEAYDYYTEQIGEDVQNIMCVVLRKGNKKIGIIRTLNKRRADMFGNCRFTSDDLVAFEALAGQISIGIETYLLLDEIKKSNKLKEFITQEYSHTLKNLMQPVVTISGLLQKNPDDQELWTLMRHEITKMKTTISTMLRLVGLNDTSLKLNKSSVDVSQMLSNMAKPYDIVAADKELKIKSNFYGLASFIIMDESLIYDAVANLLDNALKYAYPGTVININAKTKNERMCISVSDIGPIIPEEDREKIFDHLYKGDLVVDKVHQLGLGLTFVKVVTEAHGGSVYVDPDFKKGTKIVMNIPAVTIGKENQ